MKPFQNFFKTVESWFTRGKGQDVVNSVEAALTEVATVLPHAIPIVEEIAALAPNRTIEEALAVAEKYGAPVANAINADPASIGNILLNVATQAVQKALPAGIAVAVSTIQTAIQLSVTASKAAAPVPAK